MPNKIIKIAFAVLLTSFVLFQTVAAERLPVTIYTSADGLGSSFVDYPIRDSRGFMWFCTRDGLSRFDGARFVTYQIGDKNSPPGIENLFETRDGMFFVTTTLGMFRFDPNQLTQIDGNATRLNAEPISERRGNFLEDRHGTVWFVGGGIFHVKENEGKTTLERFSPPMPPEIKDSDLNGDLVETEDGSIWLNTLIGIIRFLPDQKTVFYKAENALNAGNTTFKKDNRGNLWVSRNNHLSVFKPEPPDYFADSETVVRKEFEPQSAFELVPEAGFALPEKAGEIIRFSGKDNNSFIEKTHSKKIFQSSDGTVWVTAENHLLEFSNEIFHLHNDKEGLPNVMARMAEDSAGNLWIGSYSGLARVNRNGFITYGTVEGANSSRFFAINENADGNIFFAASDFYINKFDGANLTPIRPNIPLESNFLWASRYAFVDSAKNWWFLTGDKLYRFDGVTDVEKLKTASPSHIYSKTDGLKSDKIFQIFETAKGEIWVSTRGPDTGNGVSRLDKTTGKFQTFTDADGIPADKSFSSATEDSHGNIWFSFYEGGLARFNGERFQYFGKNEGITDTYLTDLHYDGKGNLWISSAISGLFQIKDTSAATPEFINLSTADGLASNNIRTITYDDFGRIYLGSVRGVDRFTPETGKIKHYSVNDGLAADFIVDSHRDKNGDLWFATNDGVSRFAPEPEETAAAPQIFLDGLRIASEQQPFPQIGATQIDKGELSTNQNNFQIDFFGLDFRAGEALRYQYKLEGADADWSAPSDQRSQSFANLSPGTYRFLVRAVNSDGTVSVNPASVSFKILAPIWLRWWFVLAVGLTLAAIIISFYRYRISNLNKINAALTEANRAEENLRKANEERIAELEKVRSRIATDLHDDIGASLTQIAVLSGVARAQSKGNGASESLTRISDVSNELVESMSDIVWSINPKKDQLWDLAQRMRRFASDMLSASGIAFQFSSPETHNQTIINSNLRREMFLVYKELINNIVKHSQARRVRISLDVLNSELILKIEDDGSGFDSSGLDPRELTDSQFASLNPESMGGNGLRNLWRRTHEMDGEIWVDSQIGHGTKVILQFPLDATAHVGGEKFEVIG